MRAAESCWNLTAFTNLDIGPSINFAFPRQQHKRTSTFVSEAEHCAWTGDAWACTDGAVQCH